MRALTVKIVSGVAEETNGPQPIRVLMVAARFLPYLGGIETHLHEVSRRMAVRSDFEITVLTTDRSGTLPPLEEVDGVTVIRCRSYPRRRDYYFAPGVYRHIVHGQYDLIHCQGIHTAVPIFAMLAARRRKIPYMVTFHTGGHSSGLRRRLRASQWRALGPLLKRANVLIAVSRFEQQLFEKACRLDRGLFRIVQNGGDLPVVDSSVGRIPNRIISSGRLERYKGHHRVIQALPLVQRSIPGATLQILGSGPDEARLRALIERLELSESVAIEFIPPGRRDLMAQSLRAASVFVTLSEYEAHPVAVMEAVALHVPVLALEAAGTAELVEQGLAHGVPADASGEVIAQRLVKVLRAGDMRPPATVLTWDGAAAELERIYLQAVRFSPIPRPVAGPNRPSWRHRSLPKP